jgi:hypothetical protein
VDSFRALRVKGSESRVGGERSLVLLLRFGLFVRVSASPHADAIAAILVMLNADRRALATTAVVQRWMSQDPREGEARTCE